MDSGLQIFHQTRAFFIVLHPYTPWWDDQLTYQNKLLNLFTAPFCCEFTVCDPVDIFDGVFIFCKQGVILLVAW